MLHTWGLRVLLVGMMGLGACGEAFAARIVGNGGVGVECTADFGPPTLEVLDFYQARHTDWQMPPQLGDASKSYLAKAALALDRLDAVDAARSAKYHEWLAAFEDESFIFTDNHHFELINDFGSPLLQSNCHAVQIAIQRPPEVPEDRRYLIDGSKWQYLSADDKAGLVLHEIIYRDALERGQMNSVSAHYFTALLAWGDFPQKVDAAEFARRLKRYAMDAFSAVVGNRKFLYLDDGPKTREQAVAACKARSLEMGLIDHTDIVLKYDELKLSVVGQKLLANGGKTIWLSSAFSFWFNGDLNEPSLSDNTEDYVCAGPTHALVN